jgi:hypothetical protein
LPLPDRNSRATRREAFAKVALAVSMVSDVPWADHAYIITGTRDLRRHGVLDYAWHTIFRNGHGLELLDEINSTSQTFAHAHALTEHLDMALLGQAVQFVEVGMLVPPAGDHSRCVLFSTAVDTAYDRVPNGQRQGLIRQWHAAKTIGRAMRAARSGPTFKMTRDRLMHEFEELAK